jgi:hypothetical protein
VICDHISKNTRCRGDVQLCLQRYNNERRLRGEGGLREIANVIDKTRTMLETIWETRGGNECCVYSGSCGTSQNDVSYVQES